jgi:hypothetical protein
MSKQWEFYCLVEPSVYGNIWLGDESTDKRGQLFSEAVPYWKETKQSFEDYQKLTNQQWPNQNQDPKSE